MSGVGAPSAGCSGAGLDSSQVGAGSQRARRTLNSTNRPRGERPSRNGTARLTTAVTLQTAQCSNRAGSSELVELFIGVTGSCHVSIKRQIYLNMLPFDKPGCLD